jgi:hypothetical protein
LHAKKVYSAAREAKILVGEAWKAASKVTQAAYKRVRKAAGGIHLIRDTFWNILNFDVQKRTFNSKVSRTQCMQWIMGMKSRFIQVLSNACRLWQKNLV